MPPDINASKASFSVDKEAIRFGLAAVKNVGDAALNNLVQVRERDGAFKSMVDFCSRVDTRAVNKRVMESLIKCGAFDSLGGRRSQLLAVLDQALDAAASKQRDAASGQIGLFESAAMEEVEEIKLPDIPELPKKEILNLEKEITGFYITGHPLDAYRDKIKSFMTIPQILDGTVKDGQIVKLAGIIASAKRITTKKGDTMCFLQLEDFTQNIEVVVFPRVFYQNVNALVPDTPIVVQGRTNMTDTGNKIIADTVCLLDEYKPELRLHISAANDNEETFAALKDVFAAYHGEHVVYLHLIDKRKLIKTEPRFWLNASAEAIDALEKILGENSVQFR